MASTFATPLTMVPSSEDVELLQFLKYTLGEDYRRLTREIHKRYRVTRYQPVYLSLRTGTGVESSDVVSLRAGAARYAYLKAAITTPPDTYAKINPDKVKYQAYIDMLGIYKCVSLAMKPGHIEALLKCFPSELEKICQKHPGVFKYEKSTPPLPKGLIVHVLDKERFNIDVLDEMRPDIEDPYRFSEDVNPQLAKPIAAEPPHMERERAQLVSETSTIDWSQIPDETEA